MKLMRIYHTRHSITDVVYRSRIEGSRRMVLIEEYVNLEEYR